ncbi:hypothetical protein LTR22_015274 [Elasticomyces elasticus]|nr:hypothetical protein LTR22_015274 [Elasticomyces elasticus]
MSLTLIYEPLDEIRREIRLLRILPSIDRAATVHVELLTTSLDLDSTLPYSALSYVWGDARTKEAIRIDGTWFEIGESLANAFKHVRQETRDVILWADAICINQEDIPERNHQVSMMGSLYRQATKVIAWLGTTGDDRFSGLSFDEEALEALIKLSFRDYWRRVWIVQELQLASQIEFRCGDQVVQSQSFLSACWWWTLAFPFRSRETGNNKWASLVQRTPLYKMICGLPRWEASMIGTTSPSKMYILEAARTMSDLKVTDPRDKVFGLLGLLDAEFTPSTMDAENVTLDLIRPAYHNSAGLVFQNFARYCMVTERSLLLLRYCRGPGLRSKFSEDNDLPSWVPDLCDFEDLWTNDHIARKDLEVELFPDLVQFRSNNTVLVVKGIEIDQATTLYEHLSPFWPSHDRKEDCARFVRDILNGPLLNGESPLYALIRLLSGATSMEAITSEADGLKSATGLLVLICNDLVLQKTIPIISIGPGRGVSEFTYVAHLLARSYFTPGTNQEEINYLVGLMISAEDYAVRTSFWRVNGIIKDRSILFKTSHGRMGLGPRSLKSGDNLYYLAGYYRPFALRPRERAGGYLYTGECRLLDTSPPEIVPQLVPDMIEFEIH